MIKAMFSQVHNLNKLLQKIYKRMLLWKKTWVNSPYIQKACACADNNCMLLRENGSPVITYIGYPGNILCIKHFYYINIFTNFIINQDTIF